MTSRYNPHRIDMRYASPDGIRPNRELLARAHENFNQPRITHKPSPHTTRGKNRTWTVISASNSVPHRQSREREQIIRCRKRNWRVRAKSRSPQRTQVIRGRKRTWQIKAAKVKISKDSSGFSEKKRSRKGRNA